MGTRNLTCVINGGTHRVAQYGQWDGYPEGQGVTILNFLRSGDVEALKEKSLKCSYITDEEYSDLWKEFGIDIAVKKYVNMEESNMFHKKYPQFSRDVGGEILEMVASSECGLKLSNAYNFAADSVFCEWAYVVDFDKNTFEVYTGFNTTKLTPKDRFFGVVDGRKTDSEDKEKYYPVKMVAAFSLMDLPDEEEFLSQLSPPEDEDGEVVG